MTRLSFDDGEAYTFLDGLVNKKLSKRVSNVVLNPTLKTESKKTKRVDTQTYIFFKCPACNKKWKSGFGHVQVFFKFKRNENSVSFNTVKSDQQCRACGVDALPTATEVDLQGVAERLCAKVLTSLGHEV